VYSGLGTCFEFCSDVLRVDLKICWFFDIVEYHEEVRSGSPERRQGQEPLWKVILECTPTAVWLLETTEAARSNW
jgi:hypothetical protein